MLFGQKVCSFGENVLSSSVISGWFSECDLHISLGLVGFSVYFFRGSFCRFMCFLCFHWLLGRGFFASSCWIACGVVSRVCDPR